MMMILNNLEICTSTLLRLFILSPQKKPMNLNVFGIVLFCESQDFKMCFSEKVPLGILSLKELNVFDEL